MCVYIVYTKISRYMPYCNTTQYDTHTCLARVFFKSGERRGNNSSSNLEAPP